MFGGYTHGSPSIGYPLLRLRQWSRRSENLEANNIQQRPTTSNNITTTSNTITTTSNNIQHHPTTLLEGSRVDYQMTQNAMGFLGGLQGWLHPRTCRSRPRYGCPTSTCLWVFRFSGCVLGHGRSYVTTDVDRICIPNMIHMWYVSYVYIPLKCDPKIQHQQLGDIQPGTKGMTWGLGATAFDHFDHWTRKWAIPEWESSNIEINCGDASFRRVSSVVIFSIGSL